MNTFTLFGAIALSVLLSAPLLAGCQECSSDDTQCDGNNAVTCQIYCTMGPCDTTLEQQICLGDTVCTVLDTPQEMTPVQAVCLPAG